MSGYLTLGARKWLAAPVYRLGWRLVRLADRIDGKQPRRNQRKGA